jgi:hypothetical protein
MPLRTRFVKSDPGDPAAARRRRLSAGLQSLLPSRPFAAVNGPSAREVPGGDAQPTGGAIADRHLLSADLGQPE